MMKLSGPVIALLWGCLITVGVKGAKWAWPDAKRSIGDKVTFEDELERDNIRQSNLLSDPRQADEYRNSGDFVAAGPRERDPFGNRGVVSHTSSGGFDGTVDFVDSSRPNGITGHNAGILVGPGGLTGVVGPDGGRPNSYAQYVQYGGNFNRPNDRPDLGNSGGFQSNKRPVLVGPEGPTGIVGPNEARPSYSAQYGQYYGNNFNSPNKRPVLVGPSGPTGIVGPKPSFSENYGGFKPNDRPVLVGPGGPTGVVGPDNKRPHKGLLVGPGGPTGLIGPPPRPLLVGPDGPTGVIGPASSHFRPSGRPSGVLVGPGGPTGVIGPSRHNIRQYSRGVLVGPGGPTGIIGPSAYNYY